MIKKIFKTIFILSLCLGITLPSHAAVSVSDGSAFVTKSEFDADINNISNRMAQLENSLDAKIDSLVSSYLTRNGIWNGEKQELKFNTIADFWKDFTESGVYYTWKAAPTFATSLTIGARSTMRYGSYDLIESITKTGMLFGSLDVLTGYQYVKSVKPSSSGTDGRNYFYGYDWTRLYDNPYCTNACEASFWINGVCMYSLIPVTVGTVRNVAANDDGTWINGQGGIASLYFIPNPGRYSFMFFVSKGDKVVFDYRLAIIPQTWDAQGNWQGIGTETVGSYAGAAVVFDELAVY